MYRGDLKHVASRVGSGLRSGCGLDGGFPAPAVGIMWPCTKKSYDIVHQLTAENCTHTSKRNKCCMEKPLLSSSAPFFQRLREPSSSLQLQGRGIEGKWFMWIWVPHMHPAWHPAGQHSAQGKASDRCPGCKTPPAAAWKGHEEEDRGSMEAGGRKRCQTVLLSTYLNV